MVRVTPKMIAWPLAISAYTPPNRIPTIVAWTNRCTGSARPGRLGDRLGEGLGRRGHPEQLTLGPPPPAVGAPRGAGGGPAGGAPPRGAQPRVGGPGHTGVVGPSRP